MHHKELQRSPQRRRTGRPPPPSARAAGPPPLPPLSRKACRPHSEGRYPARPRQPTLSTRKWSRRCSRRCCCGRGWGCGSLYIVDAAAGLQWETLSRKPFKAFPPYWQASASVAQESVYHQQCGTRKSSPRRRPSGDGQTIRSQCSRSCGWSLDASMLLRRFRQPPPRHH